MSEENDFKVGVVVKLKSGGPEMTVRGWSSVNKGYGCQWFAGKKLEQGFFPPDSLELHKPEGE